MKALLIGINSKFIHPNVAIRSLKANSNHETILKEFTIKDDLNEIINYINSHEAKVVGLSIYIWNIELMKKIIPMIKDKTIILGGPEVSYDSDHYFDLPIDFIIKGEGELAYESLLTAIDNNSDYSNIPSLSYKKDKVISNPIEEIDLDKISFSNDIEFHKDQIQYIETSRGCPYKCSYCLASLEKTVRFFDGDKVKENILYLINNNAKTFKFLDRTFNLHTNHSLEIIKFIIDNHKPGNVFQFEITGDILNEETLELIHSAPENLFRFEIGIQSTNEHTNISVDRRQDTEKLFDVIKRIKDKDIVDLHVDLIAGLPYENLDSFKKTFNETFNLKSKELQLGFLKMLPGTKIRRKSDEYGYKFSKIAPYEIIENNFLSKQDIKDIKTVEEVLERYWNKGFMNNTMEYLLNDPFDFFLQFGKYYESNYSWFKYQLSDLFIRLLEYTDKLNDPKIKELLIYDYLKYHDLKPKKWWEPLTKQVKNQVLRDFFKTNKDYTIDELYKYAVVEKVINYIICVYKPNNKNIYIVKDVDLFKV
ncbi:DUF4080 domain-containing protein [Mycoplasmatota bacterium WC44]